MILNAPDELYLPDATVVALVGAGGKTSLMQSMAAHAVASGQTVIRTTTTKLAGDTDNPFFWDGRKTSLPLIQTRLSHDRSLTLVRDRDSTTGKLLGLAPEAVDLLAASSLADRIFVEADGARGKSIKAPADHEPVIPRSTNMVIGIIGANALDASLDETLVFRPELLAAICRARSAEPVDARILACLAAHPQGLFKSVPPPPCRRILFVNKMDMAGEAAWEMLAQARRLVRAEHPDESGFAMQWFAGSVNEGWLRSVD
ncbi:selenium cofactor biosynthesis protein YqeC [Desulfonatronum sp. SC1]|uniref:selenium cofactor biosynthesis protein YqeC n=1 Tax=Desulfonatronum sp. SC1 TaxID=2109626 RepID=UPI000D30D71C|nr:selenium cofactor biosynthesis protein YqeC [Desulfonatronum sp. SC1]PTN38015.1 putative selenium-dependent hydroxylase accessory protein YqeC [Desulfonatronum sp. SC1]